MKAGEKLVRTLIAELDERIIEIRSGQMSGRLGPRTTRARIRFAQQDYDKLVTVARRWGFKV
jgi:hypothetical protein